MRRGTSKAQAAALARIAARAEWVAEEYGAGRLSLADAEGLARDLVELRALLSLADAGRKRGRPKNPRPIQPGGMLAQALPSTAKDAKRGKGRPRRWPDGYEQVVSAVVGGVMERDGLGVKAAIERLLTRHIASGNLSEGDVTDKKKRQLRELFYRCKPKKVGEAVANAGECGPYGGAQLQAIFHHLSTRS